MSIAAVFSGYFCGSEKIALDLAKELNFNYIEEADILKETSEHFNVPIKKLNRSLYNKPS
ncbi:hypothetical protein MCHI_002824, partial [Candidatus Magnetoovum chiemensis]